MATELVTKYLPYVDELFTQESKKEILTNNDFSFDGASTVKLYKVNTAEMNDYGRHGAKDGNWSRYGKVEDLEATTQTATLKKDRSFTFVIDKLDESQTGQQLSGASALARQLREVVIPEVDTYTYGVMCSDAGIKPEPIKLTADNIYDEIVNAGAALDDELVPETGRVLTVTPSIYKLMKKCKDITMNTDIGTDLRVRGVVANLDGATVIKLAPARLPEKFGFMLSHRCACCAPTQLADYKTHLDPPGINGTLVEGRIVYDAYVFENKAKAIYYQEIEQEADQEADQKADQETDQKVD